MFRDLKQMGRWLAIAVAIGLVCCSQALAKKPPTPPGGGGGGTPPPTGTIYYDAWSLWSMNADGSQKTELPAGVYGEPSHALHAGHRWFLRCGVNGTTPKRLVIREDLRPP
jgi:hypothetical protein